MTSNINNLRSFGDFRLDAERKVLWHGDEPVKLALKEIELLCLLTENGGEVVTKDEILSRIWTDSFVEESNLSRYVYRLRKMFAEYGESEIIQTIPRRGYRFTGKIDLEPDDALLTIERRSVTETVIEVTEDSEQPGFISGPGKRSGIGFLRRNARWAAVCGLLIAVAVGGYIFTRGGSSEPTIRTIAILPLRTLGNEENRALSLGFADALITSLGKLQDIKVSPTALVTQFADENAAPIETGKKLGTDAILDGTLQKANGQLRVTLRLIRVSDGVQIWAGAFDESETRIFQLQDAMAFQTAQALKLKLNPDLGGKRPTENIEAYNLYLKGRYFWSERSIESYLKAIRAFEESIALDPNFALGYSGVADCYTLLEQRGGLTPAEAFPKAEAAARKALELDETLADAHASVGLVRALYRWDWNGAEKHYRRAIELDPNNVNALGSNAMNMIGLGRFAEAEAQLNRAAQIDPTSRGIAVYLGWLYYFTRQYDRAIEQSRKALELDEKQTTPLLILRAASELRGLQAEAVEAELSRLGRRDPAIVEPLREAFQHSGIKGFWKKQVEFLRERAGRSTEVADYNVATRLALLGETDEAILEIEKGFNNRGSMWHQIGVDPVFDSLRDDDRFKALVTRLNH